jgi:polysaccharide export outer membrane protein
MASPLEIFERRNAVRQADSGVNWRTVNEMCRATTLRRAGLVLALSGGLAATALAQVQPAGGRPAGQAPPSTIRPVGPQQPAPAPQRPAVSTGTSVPGDYVIGPDDVLGIQFWRDADMSGDVTVRPDGMITLPLIRDVKAAGLRPEELRDVIVKAASKLIEDPNVTVIVRQINSRNVFVTGQVTRPGAYGVSGEMRVLQAITLAGGLTEYAKGKKIRIVREGKSFLFNYNEALEGKNLDQNIVLKPGDTVVVP